MEVDQREYKALEILNQVKEDSKSVGVVRFLDFTVGTNFGCGEVDLFPVDASNKLLFSDFVRFGPVLIVTIHDAAVEDDSFHFVNDGL